MTREEAILHAASLVREAEAGLAAACTRTTAAEQEYRDAGRLRTEMLGKRNAARDVLMDLLRPTVEAPPVPTCPAPITVRAETYPLTPAIEAYLVGRYGEAPVGRHLDIPDDLFPADAPAATVEG
jgi:hypothetical protein